VPAIAQVEPMTTARAVRGPFDYLLPEELREAVDVGSMLVVPFGRRKVLGVVVGLAEHSELAAERLLEPLRALELGVPEALVELARWIAAEYCSTISRALALVLPPGASRRLGGRARRAAARPSNVAVGTASPRAPRLTDAQRAALVPVLEALEARRSERLLLHGVTGSGKTEVYLQASAAALERGRGAIVLVPEITLTPQIVARFGERFGDTVAVLHSRLRPAERYAEWRRLRAGEARVCVGPRSAVFAPVGDLGLIVIDEEHDASYKHEGDPRYDAREVADERARRCGAVLLAGSATPRAESMARMPVAVLSERVDGRPLPQVSVLDMRGLGHALHPLACEALAQVRDRRGKAIVLLNRRGWSNFLSCRSCGRVWCCPQCDVVLVLHRGAGIMACHHCGHAEPLPPRCSRCSSISLARHGAGTERLAHELAQVLDEGGDFPLFRLDSDALYGAGHVSGTGAGHVSGAGADPDAAGAGGRDGAPGAGADGGDALAEGAGPLLRAFQDAECGVLIGTQMVAKGHDFPDVVLGVMLDADATLRFPDFRAEERTFALIAQLAGRVGRGGEGRVLVQTMAPDARAIVHAARHDSAGFVAGELERRRALGYPPFSHLIRVVCSAAEAQRARAAAWALRERLIGTGSSGGSPAGEGAAALLGPASLFRLRGRERQVLVMKALERRAAVASVGRAVARAAVDRAHAGVSFSVDVDPQ
jgi:primosomal protein N' (replication factor Y) (superfamily II helicase)